MIKPNQTRLFYIWLCLSCFLEIRTSFFFFFFTCNSVCPISQKLEDLAMQRLGLHVEEEARTKWWPVLQEVHTCLMAQSPLGPVYPLMSLTSSRTLVCDLRHLGL